MALDGVAAVGGAAECIPVPKERLAQLFSALLSRPKEIWIVGVSAALLSGGHVRDVVREPACRPDWLPSQHPCRDDALPGLKQPGPACARNGQAPALDGGVELAMVSACENRQVASRRGPAQAEHWQPVTSRSSRRRRRKEGAALQPTRWTLAEQARQANAEKWMREQIVEKKGRRAAATIQR